MHFLAIFGSHYLTSKQSASTDLFLYCIAVAKN